MSEESDDTAATTASSLRWGRAALINRFGPNVLTPNTACQSSWSNSAIGAMGDMPEV